ncbi:MAG: restriction endonuclease subunit S [Gemmiger sp.]|uniref:restriction endonuclease subunit S n=1 Tax=Gemmiger sp. TaxID=2049027 RepID=UPI002A909A2E|nr:restriction endonuclease subunit S [Gemmiger sp.]MDY5326276.1 restriction endonuclease subunit S [Gemmiger sp.]
MREMKDSGIEWIGEIPKNKRIIRNKYLLEYIKGKLPTDTNFESAGFPYIGATDLDSHEPCKTYTRDETLPDACDSDLLVLWDGARAGLCGTHKVGKFSSTIVRIREVDSTIYRPFLYWYYKGFEDYMYQRVNGTTIPHMNRKYIEEIQMIDWTAQEQQHISDYLDRKCSQIDAIIARQQEVIEKLKAYKLSVITEAVTKGLNPDVPMKDSGVDWIGEIPEHWENRKMISILSMRVVDGPHESPELYDKGIPYISATAIENGKINFDLMRGYISEEYCDICDLRYKPQLHDILVIKLGASTGQVAIVETTDRFNIWVPLAAVRCNEKADPYFVYYAFQSDYFLKQMEMSWTYGTQQTLGVKSIERLRIMLPTFEEQKEIASYLKSKCDSIDAAVKNKENLIDKLVDYKKSLIYEVVTGKKEV